MAIRDYLPEGENKNRNKRKKEEMT